MSYTDQEWALLSYDDKGKVFYFCNKTEPLKINAVEISESSIANISNIAAGKNAGSAATDEKGSPGNRMTENTRGSA